MDPALWVVVAVVLVGVIVLWWRGSHGGGDLSIAVNGGDVRFSGAIPQAKQMVIQQFLIEDMQLETRVNIRGRRTPQGWRFTVAGQIPPGDQQRIRNFLLMTL